MLSEEKEKESIFPPPKLLVLGEERPKVHKLNESLSTGGASETRDREW